MSHELPLPVVIAICAIQAKNLIDQLIQCANESNFLLVCYHMMDQLGGRSVYAYPKDTHWRNIVLPSSRYFIDEDVPFMYRELLIRGGIAHMCVCNGYDSKDSVLYILGRIV